MRKKSNAMKSLSGVFSLDGDWDFYYTPDEPGKKLSPPPEGWLEDIPMTSPAFAPGDRPPSPPEAKSFEAKMPVPGYWDDHLENLRLASFSSTARFNPLYRKIEFPLGDKPPDA